MDRRGVVRVVDFGLAAFADRRLGFVPGSMGTFTYMAPETLLGRSTPASDIYSLGLLLYELFTGGGPHLSVPWSTDDKTDHRDEHYRLKKALRFPPPSEVQNEIRNDNRWLDALILRCLETDPARRIPDAGKLLAAVETCETGGELPPCRRAETGESRSESPMLDSAHRPTTRWTDCSVRCAACWPASSTTRRSTGWTSTDRRSGPWWTGWAPARCGTLGQAYLGRGDLTSARECLEQLRDAHHQQPLLPRADYAASLSDLHKCYRALGLTELAKACQEEARGLL